MYSLCLENKVTCKNIKYISTFLIILILNGVISEVNFTNKNEIPTNSSKALASPSNGTLDGVAKFPIPYHVSIQGKQGKHYEHLCAGTIIDESFVLTAAHCFFQIRNPKKLMILAGSNKLSKGRPYKVEKVIIHDFYEPLMGRDIALLKVKPKFKFDGKTIDKINFNVTKETKEDELTYLIGWGRTKMEPNKNLELVSFRTLSKNKCRKRGFKYVSSTELCAISRKGRGACDGDSGGALVNQKFRLQLGILSYGREPCKRNRIYAFTYLYPLVEWIKKQIKENR